ncbi:MAG: hypothetical protein IJN00_03205, partial [Clostridia bacterium]|nr:hypothetical protein [Clostridia bacterium]
RIHDEYGTEGLRNGGKLYGQADGKLKSGARIKSVRRFFRSSPEKTAKFMNKSKRKPAALSKSTYSCYNILCKNIK